MNKLTSGLLVAVVAIVATACSDSPTIVQQPTEIVEVSVPFPVPGDTQVIEVPVPVYDTALVRLLLRGLGEIAEIECVVEHEHAHRADVCAIIANTMQGMASLSLVPEAGEVARLMR